MAIIAEILNQAQFKPNLRRLGYKMENLSGEVEIFKKIGTKYTLNDGLEFEIDAENRFIIENLIKWAHNSEFECLDYESLKTIKGNPNKGIYLAGKSGSGKSLIMRVFSEYLGLKGFVYSVKGGTILLAFNQLKTSKVGSIIKDCGDKEFFVEMPSICFQDFGSEDRFVKFMGSEIDYMRTIVNDRFDNDCLLTHFTSNLSLRLKNGDEKNAITAKYDDARILRRLRTCNYFELSGKDRSVWQRK